MVRLIGFGLILVLPLKLCKLNMTNNNCINEHKGSKDFFFYKIVQNALHIAQNIG